MATCSREGWLRISPATTWKAMFSSAITSTLQILSWPACSFPVYTVGLVALLASYSYIGTLRVSTVGAFETGQTINWSSSIASGVAVHHDNLSSCGGLACDVDTSRYIIGPQEQSGDECVTAWTSWNASSTALPSSMASPSGRSAMGSALLDTSRAESERSCTRADSTKANAQSHAPHLGWPMNDHIKSERIAWPTERYTYAQLVTAKNAITAIQWIGLHITVVSLFIAMRKSGSNFWLAIGVLMSST
ncbi:3-hydroxy-3-methylglutaryl-coenzyme A (HMG-CoA) reductase isozyme, partial [Elasticomyces elasticus]